MVSSEDILGKYKYSLHFFHFALGHTEPEEIPPDRDIICTGFLFPLIKYVSLIIPADKVGTLKPMFYDCFNKISKNYGHLNCQRALKSEVDELFPPLESFSEIKE